MTIPLDEYLKFIADRLAVAQASGNRDEVLRLLGLLRQTVDETIEKIRTAV